MSPDGIVTMGIWVSDPGRPVIRPARSKIEARSL
jgi:hypothetical protein